MGEKFLRPDGYVEWRPDTATVNRVAPEGGHVIDTGQLCTACLVGDWGMTLLKATKRLCDDCLWLQATVDKEAGLSERGRATRPAPPRYLSKIDDPTDPAWEPLRAARRLRAERLAEVFAWAEDLGVVITASSSGGGTAPLLDLDDVERLGLIPAAAEDRVRRFADWLRILAPLSYAERRHVLDDVDRLAALLSEHLADVQRRRARAELDRVARDAAAALAKVARTPRALGQAVAGVVVASTSRPDTTSAKRPHTAEGQR